MTATASDANRGRHIEKEDLRDFLMAVLIVPAVWIAAFGWFPDLMVCEFDGTTIDLYIIDQMMRTGGDWRALLYRVGWLGGSEVFNVAGFSWPLQVAAWLGLSAPTTINLVNFGTQSAHAFLALRLTLMLASHWKGTAVSPPLLLRVVLLLLLAFAPVLGWKLSRSHWSMVMGTAVFEAALVLVVGGLSSRLTLTTTLVSLALFCFAFGGAGQQPVLYGAVFGFPILVGLAWGCRRRDRRALVTGLAVPILLALAALALVAPSFFAMLARATGDDAARTLGGPPVVYSYVIAKPADWWASLPWNLGIIDLSRAPERHHETNFPLGPMLLLVAAIPWRRAWALGVGLALSALFAALFSMNAQPFSDAVLRAFPWLGSFRVPMRSLLPFVLTLPTVGLAAVLFRFDERLSRPSALLLGTAIAFLALKPLPALVAESILWLVTALALVLMFRRTRFSRLAFATLLAVLSGGSLVAFGMRLTEFPRPNRIYANVARAREVVLERAPELANPLNRAAYSWQDPEVRANTAALAGLASAGGYGFPGRRFLQLYSAALGIPYDPTTVNLNWETLHRAVSILGPLYNLKWTVSRVEGGLALTPNPATAGAAWFSNSVERIADYEQLVALARTRSDDAQQLRARLPVIESDQAARAAIGAWTSDPSCAESRVLSAGSPDGQSIHVRFRSGARCPLTMATNFAQILRAHVVSAPATPLSVFPGWGALTSVMVPPGDDTLVVEPKFDPPVATRIAQVVGILLALAAFFLVWRVSFGAR